MNTIFGDMAANLATFDPQTEAINAAKPAAKEIVNLNRHDQMFEQGIDARGDKIGGGRYANSTIEKKKSEGQRYDHITLRDTQAFHKSMEVRFEKGSFEIIGDDRKESDTPGGADSYLTEIYGTEILGLTNENLDFIKEKHILPALKTGLKNRLFANKNTP